MDSKTPAASEGPDGSTDAVRERSASQRVTLADLARMAGVSKATVSRTLNGKPDVDMQTRQRILQLVAATGYRPDPTARALRGLSPLSAQIAPLFAADFLWGIGT